jgi:NifU-like protein involved in Fe-S cluster formation
LLTELLQGSTLEAARSLQRSQLIAGVGGLTNESMHASHLAIDALKAVLAQVKA